MKDTLWFGPEKNGLTHSPDFLEWLNTVLNEKIPTIYPVTGKKIAGQTELAREVGQDPIQIIELSEDELEAFDEE